MIIEGNVIFKRLDRDGAAKHLQKWTSVHFVVDLNNIEEPKTFLSVDSYTIRLFICLYFFFPLSLTISMYLFMFMSNVCRPLLKRGIFLGKKNII